MEILGALGTSADDCEVSSATARVHRHIGIQSRPKGSLPRLIGTTRDRFKLFGLLGPIRPYWSG